MLFHFVNKFGIWDVECVFNYELLLSVNKLFVSHQTGNYKPSKVFPRRIHSLMHTCTIIHPHISIPILVTSL